MKARKKFDIKKISLLAKAIRRNSLLMTARAKSSHIGSIFSIADILAVLYGSILNFNSKKPKDLKRDFFILSKGHAGAGLYVALAEVGFFSKKKLASYYQNGQFLSGHVSHVKVPGVEVSTGSLGHGISIASGIALAKKIEKKRNRIFVLASDGELDEGSSWEAILFASHFKLNNLILIIDRNYLQSIKSTEKTLALEPLKKKFHAFGWNVEYARGHSYLDLHKKLNKTNNKKPLCIIAKTIKGKGLPYMENKVAWHYKSAEGYFLTKGLEILK